MKERLIKLRDENHLTQKEVANYLKISQITYTRYETGNNSLTIEHLIKLSKLYNTSTDYLLNLTDLKDNYNNINKITI